MLGRAAILLGFILELAVNVPSPAMASVNPYPRALQGIWFSDEPEGRMQCRAFLTAFKSDDDIAFDRLVGSEMIRGDLWHSVAEYGEGNFYKLRKLTKIGVLSWRVEADIGIDSYPDGHEDQHVHFEVVLANRKMLWSENSPDDRPGLKGKTRRYFRCRAVPASFGRK